MSILKETKMSETPECIEDMEFCHIVNEGRERTLCGLEKEGNGSGPEGSCGDYDGSAICQGCLQARCPRCAQLALFEDALGWI